MTGPISPNRLDRENDVFVESPTRPNKTAVESVIGNVSELANAIGQQIGSEGTPRNATQIVSALKCVTSVSTNSVKYANNNITLSDATVFGITLTAAQTNEVTFIKKFGTLRDSSFNWPTNTQIYLGINGSLTDIAPLTGHRTLVAVSEGPGAININIQEPIVLI